MMTRHKLRELLLQHVLANPGGTVQAIYLGSEDVHELILTSDGDSCVRPTNRNGEAGLTFDGVPLYSVSVLRHVQIVSNALGIDFKRESWKEFERRCGEMYWRTLAWITAGRIVEMSRLSGVNRTDTYKRLQRYGVRLISTARNAHKGAWDRPVANRSTSKKAPVFKPFKGAPKS